VHVDRERAQPLVDRELRNGANHVHAALLTRTVDRAQGGARFVDPRGARVEVAQIGNERHRLATGRFDGGHVACNEPATRLSPSLRCGPRTRRARRRPRAPRDRLTDAAAGAGDDGHLALQSIGHDDDFGACWLYWSRSLYLRILNVGFLGSCSTISELLGIFCVMSPASLHHATISSNVNGV
jgi:hypothetical protein